MRKVTQAGRETFQFNFVHCVASKTVSFENRGMFHRERKDEDARSELRYSGR